MPSQSQGPQPTFTPFPCDGVLNEWLVPPRVGGQGLTNCANVIYHRMGGWGKRPGTTRAQLPQNQDSSFLNNGIRWYRVFPTPVTKLVVWSKNQLVIGDNPESLTPVGNAGQLSLTGNISPDFCSMRDPQARQGNGADVLIMTGITLAGGSFGTGSITIQGLPSSNTSATVTLIVGNSTNSVTTATYNILPTDNPASIAAQIAQMLNQSAAFLNQGNFPPFLGETYYIVPNDVQNVTTPPSPPLPQAIVKLGARNGGAAGNNIVYRLTIGGTDSGSLAFYIGSPPNEIPVSIPETSPYQELTGGGNDWSGPLRYDYGTGTVEGLSYMAPNAFTGCCTWHDHAWFWGDPTNPDTVFACDLNQPESFTFMEENGGMKGPQNGGYDIGQGDGDPGVQCVYPNGNSLCVFKTGNIYQIQGYDFQTGEYQFSITQQVVGYGIPSRDCVAVLEGQYVFWSGRKFLRLAVGAYEPEHIGLTIPITEAIAAQGNQANVKVVAGDFQVLSALLSNYEQLEFGTPGGSGGSPGTDNLWTILRSLALFAVDSGSGQADLVVVYDDEKTAIGGTYAWSKWTGWNVGSWIPYGTGQTFTGAQDKPRLYFVGFQGNYLYYVGNQTALDFGGAPIPWSVQTGVIDFESPELIKQIHNFFLRVQALAGATFTVTAIPSRIVPAIPEQSQYPSDPVQFVFGPTLAPTNAEALNNLKAYIQSALQVQALVIKIFEDGTSGSQFEMLSYAIDANPQEGYPN